MRLDFALGCAGNMDRDCSVWDRIISLSARCAAAGVVYQPGIEVGRWINPFQRRGGRWLTYAPLAAALAPAVMPVLDAPSRRRVTGAGGSLRLAGSGASTSTAGT